MPELMDRCRLGVLQDRGFKVAIVTDGRMSGASGKVASAIHVIPEAANGGILSKIRTGDRIRLDVDQGSMTLLVDSNELQNRESVAPDTSNNRHGFGRELFQPYDKCLMRKSASILISLVRRG
jgi:phosphogluconate dehydratase